MVFCIWIVEIFEKKEPTTKRFYGRVTWSMHLSCILYGMKWETIYTCDYNPGFKHLVSSLTQQRYDNPIQPDTQHKFANLSQFETVLQCCLWYSFLPTEHMTLQISAGGGFLSTLNGRFSGFQKPCHEKTEIQCHIQLKCWGHSIQPKRKKEAPGTRWK